MYNTRHLQQVTTSKNEEKGTRVPSWSLFFLVLFSWYGSKPVAEKHGTPLINHRRQQVVYKGLETLSRCSGQFTCQDRRVLNDIFGR